MSGGNVGMHASEGQLLSGDGGGGLTWPNVAVVAPLFDDGPGMDLPGVGREPMT